MINNRLEGKLKYVAVREEDLNKTMELLEGNQISYNQYDSSHSVFCNDEARNTRARVQTNMNTLRNTNDIKDDIDIQTELYSLEDSIYERLYKSQDLECGVYDNEFIYETEEDELEKFITRISNESMEA